MATEIASEAAKVLAGGESVPTTVPETVSAAVPADALLGGSVEAIEGGKRLRRSPSQRRGYRSPHRYASGVDRSAGRVRKMHSVHRKSKKTGKVSKYNRHSARRSASRISRSRALRAGGGEQIEGGYSVISGRYPSGVDRSASRKRHMVADYHVRGHYSKTRSGKKVWVKPFDVLGRQTSRRSRSSIRRSRSKRSLKAYVSRAIRGGEAGEMVPEVVAPIAGGDLEGGKRRRMRGGAAPVPAVEAPIVGGDVVPIEGGKKRRSRKSRRSRSRRSRSRRSRMRGGEAEVIEGGEVEAIEGGKKRSRKSRSRKSRKSRTAWQRLMAAEAKKHSPTKAGFAAASRAASKKYHA